MGVIEKGWGRDLPGLDDELLRKRYRQAVEGEQESMRKGMGRNPKAARAWREAQARVLAELEKRGLEP